MPLSTCMACSNKCAALCYNITFKACLVIYVTLILFEVLCNVILICQFRCWPRKLFECSFHSYVHNMGKTSVIFLNTLSLVTKWYSHLIWLPTQLNGMPNSQRREPRPCIIESQLEALSSVIMPIYVIDLRNVDMKETVLHSPCVELQVPSWLQENALQGFPLNGFLKYAGMQQGGCKLQGFHAHLCSSNVQWQPGMIRDSYWTRGRLWMKHGFQNSGGYTLISCVMLNIMAMKDIPLILWQVSSTQNDTSQEWFV